MRFVVRVDAANGFPEEVEAADEDKLRFGAAQRDVHAPAVAREAERGASRPGIVANQRYDDEIGFAPLKGVNGADEAAAGSHGCELIEMSEFVRAQSSDATLQQVHLRQIGRKDCKGWLLRTFSTPDEAEHIEDRLDLGGIMPAWPSPFDRSAFAGSAHMLEVDDGNGRGRHRCPMHERRRLVSASLARLAWVLSLLS